MLVLRQTVTDLIVITLLCHEDVHLQVGGSGRVECAHRDADPISRRRIEEQGRSARRAEPPSYLRRRLVPGQVLLTRDRDRRFGHVRGSEVVA